MVCQDDHTDIRIRKTNRAIIKAFFELLSRESFTNITILKLAQTAEIGQTTFYRHYQDKLDLTQQLINQHIDQLGHLFLRQLDTGCPDEIVFPPDADYQQLLKRIRLLLNIENSEISFEQCATAHIAELVRNSLANQKLRLQYPIEVSYFLSSLIYSLTMSFVAHGEDHKLEVLTKQIDEMMIVIHNFLSTYCPSDVAAIHKQVAELQQ